MHAVSLVIGVRYAHGRGCVVTVVQRFVAVQENPSHARTAAAGSQGMVSEVSMAFSMQLHEVQKFNTRNDVMVFLEGHLFLNMHWGRTVKKGHGL